MSYNRFDILEGKIVAKVFVSANQDTLYAETDSGTYAFETYGDCCSETWFADITGLHNLLGNRITATREIEMPNDGDIDDGRSRQEYDRIYGFRVETKEGYTDIIFRNSSNGYYGGWIEEAKSVNVKENLREITEDNWQA